MHNSLFFSLSLSLSLCINKLVVTYVGPSQTAEKLTNAVLYPRFIVIDTGKRLYEFIE